MRVDRKKHTGYFPEHPNTCQPPRSHMTNESDLAAIRPNGQAAPSHPTHAGAPDRGVETHDDGFGTQAAADTTVAAC